MKFLITDILWDKEVDGEQQEIDLPASMEVDAEDDDIAIDVASDTTGFCILSATVNAVPIG